MKDIFAKLERAGVDRRGLYLAWDFTVASERGLSERMLHIRDDAFRQLGDTDLSDKSVKGRSPRFTVDSVQDFGQCGADGCQQGENDQVARRVAGNVFVPCYLDETNCPTGSTFHYSKGSSLPTQIPGNERAANFICNIPRSAVSGERIRKAHPSLYGHGLLGSADEVDSGKLYTIGDDNGIMFCATDWIGLARDDRATAPETYRDISKFPTAADRGQQGMLDFLYLGRAMIHPDGFAADPAFRFEKNGRTESVVDTRELLYMGGSQGGIMGGALTAVAPDFTKAVLGVPGMNYSLQLNRSVDFAPFQTIFDQNYPDKLDQQVIFGLLQMLWDRSEASGYAHHMTTDTYPDTPEHKVLMLVSYGDHQVSTWASAVEARTIGARIRTPSSTPGGRRRRRRSGGSRRSSGRRTAGRRPSRSGTSGHCAPWTARSRGHRRRPSRTCPTTRAWTRTGRTPRRPRRGRSNWRPSSSTAWSSTPAETAPATSMAGPGRDPPGVHEHEISGVDHEFPLRRTAPVPRRHRVTDHRHHAHRGRPAVASAHDRPSSDGQNGRDGQNDRNEHDLQITVLSSRPTRCRAVTRGCGCRYRRACRHAT
ncbi:hypothetical protein ACFQX6_64825 [Streptosporangium lutulentum]